jgi:pimeloyl-ACP methyl ester carboxylesterase
MVVPHLARGRRVITVDLPGFGASAPVDEGFTLGEVAERIARGLSAQGVRGPYDLIGHSLGGGLALTLADRRPHLVRRLILVAPAGFQPLPASLSAFLAATADAVFAVRREAAPLADRAWGRRLLLLGAAADGATMAPALARRLVGASATARRTAPALQTITGSDLRPLLARVPVPVGLIWGQADRSLPIRMLGPIAEIRPDARIIELRDAGHVPMVERPDAFVTAVETLLAAMPELLNNETTPFRDRTTVL